MASLFLKRTISAKPTFADRFFDKLNVFYKRGLRFCLHHTWATVGSAFVLLAASLLLFTPGWAREFIPTLDEARLCDADDASRRKFADAEYRTFSRAQKTLMEQFPEIKHVVAKIGTAEVPTDPMAVEDADVMIIMKPFKEWTSASSRAEMVEKMKKALETVEGAEFNFSQPIQLRFNELMTGAKADIAIKLYGEDMEELYRAKEAAIYVEQVPGAADVIVEQAMGLPATGSQVQPRQDCPLRYEYRGTEYDYPHGLCFGEAAGVIFENERRFDLVLRLDNDKVSDLNLDKLFVRTAEGIQIPVSEVASIEAGERPLCRLTGMRPNVVS